jgi:D-amino peptidase
MQNVMLIVVAGALAVALPAPMAAQAQKLKVHISVDMEGVAGAVTGDQLGPAGFEYGRFREFMTREAMAAVTAAKEAGATEIVVADSHGNGENLLIEQFPADVRIVRSWPRPLSMMGGVDDTFDAAIFIGYHASTTNTAGVRAHTFSSATLTRVALNGVEMTEGSWNAAIAGHFNVPVVMMSGDDAAIAEVRKVVGNIEGAETKKSLGFHSAITLTPQAAVDLIGRQVKAGLARRAEFTPYKPTGQVTVDLSFKHYRPVEVLAYLPMFERTSAHSIRFRAKDMVEASAVMEFIGEYEAGLTP